MTHRVYHNLDEVLANPKELAEFREKFIPAGSGSNGLCRYIVELVERYADEKGWDLDTYIAQNKRIMPSHPYRPKKRWHIYLGDRECAKAAGDPCLGVVVANNKIEAEKEAGRQNLISRRGLNVGAGYWAVPIKDE